MDSASPPTNTTTPASPSPGDKAAIAEAALRRLGSPAPKAPNAKEQFEQERELRQKFRRLIDPGIIRPNSDKVAALAMQTLLKLAENLLREPDNDKYRCFKPTNDAIRTRIVEPSGALEYAIALGFAPEIRDFQPFYVWHARAHDKLRIGVDILREAVALDTDKRERFERARKLEKEAADAVKRNVALQYADDRKAKELRDERERIAREARAAAARVRAPQASLETAEDDEPARPARPMPGSGHRLNPGADDAAGDDDADSDDDEDD